MATGTIGSWVCNVVKSIFFRFDKELSENLKINIFNYV